MMETLNRGTVFKITNTGQFTNLYSFCSQTSCADGSTPLPRAMQSMGLKRVSENHVDSSTPMGVELGRS